MEETNDEVMEETNEENNDEEREEETNEENNDEEREEETRDEIEMLRSMEKRFDTLEEKIDNMISMYVDSGAIIQDNIDDVSENERESYDDDFINIDEMDLKL